MKPERRASDPVVPLNAAMAMHAPAVGVSDAEIGLILADGQPIVLQGLRHTFQNEPRLCVLASCTSDEETLDAVRRHDPAVLVLDLRLPSRGGLAVLRHLGNERLRTRVVMFTASIEEDELVDAIRLGARGVLLKALAPRLIVECVRQVHGGAMWLEMASIASFLQRTVQRQTSLRELRQRLTRRELQILELVAVGLRTPAITARLGIAEGTVKIHLHNIYEKLGLKDRLQLAQCARDSGLV
jgi:DNA-binding NarL/FixJ family response regulator